MSSFSLEVRRHVMDDLAPCATFGVFGRRRTGKSTLGSFITETLYSSGCSRFVVFCGSKEGELEWARTVPRLYVHGTDLDQFTNIVRWQDARVGRDREEFEEMEHMREKSDPEYKKQEYKVPKRLHLTLVVDDCGQDKAFMHSQIMRDLGSNGRHYGINLILMLQDAVQLFPEVRTQMDYILMLQTPDDRTIDRIFKEYVTSTCCSIKSFRCILAACTNKKGKCLMVDNARGSMIMGERLFFVTIPLPKGSMVGAHRYREYAERHFCAKRESSTRKSSRAKLEKSRKIEQMLEDQSTLSSSQDLELFYDEQVFQDPKGGRVAVQLKHHHSHF